MDNKGIDWVYIMNPKIHNDDACDFIRCIKTQMDERKR